MRRRTVLSDPVEVDSRWRILFGRPETLADRLPWFGEDPFEPRRDGQVCRDAANDVGFVRRVLLSWLLGRPVSAVARRAGCSSRLVYGIIRQNIFFSDATDGLERWLELGLVIVPGVEEQPKPNRPREPSSAAQAGTHVPVFCGICHLPLGRYEVSEDRPDGVLLTSKDLGWDLRNHLGHGPELSEVAVPVQAHLINHFRLHNDPIPVPKEDPWGRLQELVSPDEVADEARRKREVRETIMRRMPWRNRIPDDVVQKANRTFGWSLLPVRGGREMTEREAQKMWRRALVGDSTTPEPPERPVTRRRRRGRASRQ